jgi:[acyl-carrier-protein] S-malonyltransferase
MGKDLADAFPQAKQTFEEADDVLGTSLSSLMWNGPEEELTLTRNAQPAILIHSIAVYRLIANSLPEIKFAAGHSLGEFTAYVAARTMSFADAVRTVRRRGELMFRAGLERPGAMAAILGISPDALEAVCLEASVNGGEVVLANYNSPHQLVISGDVPSVLHAMDTAKGRGAKKTIQLNVSGAFHSPLMASAEAGLRAQLDNVALEQPEFPVISNVNAQPVTNVVDARRLLIEQLTKPVRWTACMHAIVAGGVTKLIEVGPGNVLTGLMKRIDKGADVKHVGTAAEVNAWTHGESAAHA